MQIDDTPGTQMANARRLMTLLIIASLLLCPLGVAYADYETHTVAHDIAISYDNSGSMYDDERWSNAKYALEVLAAMMDEGDTLTTFTMDQPNAKIVLSGTEASDRRVAAVHNTDFGTSEGTFIDPSRLALDALMGSGADERFLVIMTDGAYNVDGTEIVDTDEGLRRIQQIAEAASAEGITTIYMAIGESAISIEPNESKGIYLKETSSDNILGTMLEVANQVYGRSMLPEQYWDVQSGKVRFDVPMSKIVVFAQGEHARVGQLKGGGTTYDGAQAQVSWSQVGSEVVWTPNKRLHGTVVVFDGEMAAGDYGLDVSDAESLAIYYLPFADIVTTLVNADGVETSLEPDIENDLPAGKYTVSMKLLDPFTGQELNSPMIDGVDCKLEVTHDGTTLSYRAGEEVSFEEGETTIQAFAEMSAGVRIFQRYDGVRIGPERESLSVDVSAVPAEVRYDEDSKALHPVGKIVVSRADGKKLSADEWSLMQLVPSSGDGLVWDVVKSEDELGVFSVTLRDYGTAPGGLDWVMAHLLPFVSHGLARQTTFTAQIQSSVDEWKGSEEATTHVTGAFLWWLLVLIVLLILILCTIIHLYRIRPRLPDLCPAIDLGGSRGICEVVGEIRRNLPLNPLLPETAVIPLVVDEVADDVLLRVLRIGEIGLVAVRPDEGHGRYCQVDEPTRARMVELNNSQIPAGFDVLTDDEEGVPITFSKTKSIGFTGLHAPWQRGRGRTAQYEILIYYDAENNAY